MYEISRKDGLSKNLNRMRKMYPDDFAFYPASYNLPGDIVDFKAMYAKRKAKTIYISKPVAGCQGKGIFLFKNMDDIDPQEPQVVQRYIPRPHTLGGYKYDLRIYLLVASVEPLRLFVYKKGMARLATQKYCEPTGRNMDQTFMHLTNYSLNKKSEDFVSNEEASRDDEGSKQSLDAVWRALAEEGANTDSVWAAIKDIFVKTVIAIQPSLVHNYRTCLPNDRTGTACFEILGMDILIDSKFTPWLIEVNHSPSFNVDSPLDYDLKHSLLYDALNLLHLDPAERARAKARVKAEHTARLYRKPSADKVRPRDIPKPPKAAMAAEEWEESHMGGFEKVYPAEGGDYERFSVDKGLYCETTASRVRRDETRRKMEASRERAELEKKARDSKARRPSAEPRARKKRERPLGSAPTHGSQPPPNQDRFESLYNARTKTTRPAPRLASVGPAGSDTTSVFVAGDVIEPHAERSRIADKIIRERLITASGVRDAIYRMVQGDPQPMAFSQPRPAARIEPRVPHLSRGMASSGQVGNRYDRSLQGQHVGLGPVIRSFGTRR